MRGSVLNETAVPVEEPMIPKLLKQNLVMKNQDQITDLELKIQVLESELREAKSRNVYLSNLLEENKRFSYLITTNILLLIRIFFSENFSKLKS